MGRIKTVHTDLPPRMVARVMAKGRRLYYYNMGGKRIPLGDDLNIAREKLAELEANKIIPDTFRAIAERYRAEVLPKKSSKTAQSQSNQLEKLIQEFGKFSLNNISTLQVKKYLESRTAKVAANREIALLSHIWNTATGWGLTNQENPCLGVNRNRESPKYPEFGGKTPITWLRNYWPNMRYTPDQILASADDYPACANDGQDHCGIYFLITDDVIRYVGQAKQVFARLRQHFYNKPFEKVFTFEAPSILLDTIEAAYIHKLKPEWNTKIPPLYDNLPWE